MLSKDFSDNKNPLISLYEKSNEFYNKIIFYNDYYISKQIITLEMTNNTLSIFINYCMDGFNEINNLLTKITEFYYYANVKYVKVFVSDITLEFYDLNNLKFNIDELHISFATFLFNNRKNSKTINCEKNIVSSDYAILSMIDNFKYKMNQIHFNSINSIYHMKRYLIVIILKNIKKVFYYNVKIFFNNEEMNNYIATSQISKVGTNYMLLLNNNNIINEDEKINMWERIKTFI